MDEKYDLLDDLELCFTPCSTPVPELTEEEIEAIELGADRWLMSDHGL